MTIAVVAKTVAGHKIPEIEQTLSAAAAAMNILNADRHALEGFGARWVTGGNCYDPEFKQAFGLDATDQLIGFIHVGTPPEDLPTLFDPVQPAVEWGAKQ